MSRGESCSPRSSASPPRSATATAADVPAPQPAGTAERTLTSTAASAGGGNASIAASSSGWRATRDAPGTTGYRSPNVSTCNTTGSGPAVAPTETATPGVTAIFKTRPGPPNHVSVHPPMSQIRTGTDASITSQHLSVLIRQSERYELTITYTRRKVCSITQSPKDRTG